MSDFDPFGAFGARTTSAPKNVGRIAARSSAWAADFETRTLAAGSANEGLATSSHGRILIVCTGNVCRSPYIERRLQAALAGTGIVMHSAGTGALEGNPIDPSSGKLLTGQGIGSDDFRARQLTAEMVRNSDLVLTATRDHRAATVRIARTGLDRTFALVDFADLVAGVTTEEIVQASGANGCERLAAVARARRPYAHTRIDGADIRDPFRQAFSDFEAMQIETDPSLEVVVAALRLATDVSA